MPETQSSPLSAQEIIFASETEKSLFRAALGKVETDACIRKWDELTVFAIRPKNIADLEKALIGKGIAGAPAAQRVLRFLQNHPLEFIRFEYEKL